ncbi:MAG: cupin domain-containing protein [Candidatus Latescibacterota bacterium]
MDAVQVIELLGLEPLPGEGGYYRETYRSGLSIPRRALSGRYPGDRPFGTAIYYLITPDSFSALHRVPGDEIFHFYYGDPVTMILLFPDGGMEALILGNNLVRGQRPQCVAPGGVWQGMRLVGGGMFALMGTTMSPGFDFADYETGDRDSLMHHYPQRRELIREFTRG